MTPSALDTPILAGGFNGLAKCASGFTLTTGIEPTATPTAYIAPTTNGGTDRDAGGPAHSVALWEGPTSPMGATASCTGGNVLTCNSGADPSFQAPAGLPTHLNSANASPIAPGGGPGSAANQVTFEGISETFGASDFLFVTFTMTVFSSLINTAITFNLVQDAGGSEVILPPIAIVTADPTNAFATATLSWGLEPGAGTHSYSIRASNFTAGQTVSVGGDNEASVSALTW